MSERNLPALITQAESKIAAVLPPGMDAGRVVRLARLAAHKDKALLSCDPISVIEAIMVASQLGLEIGSPLGGAHLVAYGRKCQMIPDYRGLIQLALRTGKVSKIIAHEVYESDFFEVTQGTIDKIVHHPVMDGEKRKDEQIIAFYAVATMTDGSVVFEVATRGDIDAVAARSKAGMKGPWKTDYAAMGKKTIMKRLFKWLAITPELGLALELDIKADIGEVQEVPQSIGALISSKSKLKVDEDTGEILSGAEVPEDEPVPSS